MDVKMLSEREREKLTRKFVQVNPPGCRLLAAPAAHPAA